MKKLLSFLVVLPLATVPVRGQSESKPAPEAPFPSPLETGFVSLFDGKTLTGWHVSAKSGHSATSKHTTGGRWVVENGAITGSQDVPGNGGLIITGGVYGDFEVALEMNNDFGPDSGLFLRSTEDGKAWQAMIDYHSGGNLMGIYGEGLGGTPHVRNYNFTDKVTEIEAKKTGEPPTALPVLPESWPYFWRAGVWNELRARIEGNPPHITTWINGVKIMEWQEKEVRHQEKGALALQVHGGGDFTKKFVRYRNIRVKDLTGKKTAQATLHSLLNPFFKFETELKISVPAASPGNSARTGKELIISINKDGITSIKGETLTPEAFKKRLESTAALDPKTQVLITGERGTPYQKILTVLDAVNSSKLHRASFVVQESEK